MNEFFNAIKSRIQQLTGGKPMHDPSPGLPDDGPAPKSPEEWYRRGFHLKFPDAGIAKPTAATPTPSPTKSPTVAPTVTPAMAEILGRSGKFKAVYNDTTRPNAEIIRSQAQKYGVMPELMLDISSQESMLGQLERTSGYHPTERSASGLFHFTAPTWEEGIKRFGKQLGISNPGYEPYSQEWLDWIDQSRMDPELNAAMTALFMKNKLLGRWNASKDVWGPNYSPEELAPYYPQTQATR